MPVIFTEGKLQFTFNNVVSARKFDGADHGLGHCMRAVDFIVELGDRYYFIEVKDPQSYPASADNYLQDFTSERIDEDLKRKYRDSFLYEWASGRADKPIYYLMLIGLDTLTSQHLYARQNAMEGKLPLLKHAPPKWTRSIIAGCGVFNIDAWNRRFPNYPVQRLP